MDVRRITTSLAFMVTVLVSVHEACAEEDRASRCGDVLKIAFRDTYGFALGKSVRYSVYDFACDERSNETLKSQGAEANIPIPQLKAVIGANWNESKVQNWRSKSCAIRDDQFSEDEAMRYAASVLSPIAKDAVAAWSQCMADLKASSGPANVELRDYDGKRFSLLVSRQPDSLPGDPEVENFSVTNATCEPSPKKVFPPKSKLAYSKPFTCVRQKDAERIVVSMSFVNRNALWPNLVIPVKAQPVVIEPPNPVRMCNGKSIDTRTDPANCGGCDLMCGNSSGGTCSDKGCAKCEFSPDRIMSQDGEWGFSCQMKPNTTVRLDVHGEVRVVDPTGGGDVNGKLVEIVVTANGVQGRRVDTIPMGDFGGRPQVSFVVSDIKVNDLGILEGKLHLRQCAWATSHQCDLSKLRITAQ